MRPKKTEKAKEPIRIRLRELANGNKSIYLDQYYNGKRTYENLHLYLIPETSHAAKVANANTMETARVIKAQRIIALTAEATGVQTAASKKANALLLSDWMETVAQSRLTTHTRKGEERSDSYIKNMGIAARHLEIYAGADTLLTDVDKDFCTGFIEYLRTAKQLKRGRAADLNAPRHAERERKAASATTPAKGTQPLSESSRTRYYATFVRTINTATATPPEPSTTLGDWMEQRAKEEKSPSKAKFLRATARHLEIYSGARTTLADVTPEFLQGFAKYMETANQLPPVGGTPAHAHTHAPIIQDEARTISKNTAYSYFVCFKYAIEQAVEKGMIKNSPLSREDVITKEDPKRDYLTIDELRAMIATPTRSTQVKQAFIFACFCGLRISDVRALKWQYLIDEGGFYRLSKEIIKTRKDLTTYITKEAAKWLPARDEAQPDGTIFTLPSIAAIEATLSRWATRAGVQKHVTFHTSRHTFATTLITEGADIYTTQKLLGHSNVQTTQIYAELVDEKKREAINLLDEITAGTIQSNGRTYKPRAKKATK